MIKYILPFLLSFPFLAHSWDVDLRDGLTPVKSQGHYRNTCSAFAATALMEYLIFQKEKVKYDLSESWNYWAAKEYTLTNDYLQRAYGSSDGLAGYLAVEGLRYGFTLEKDWSYSPKVKQGDCTGHECYTGIPPKELEITKLRFGPEYITRHKIGQWMTANKRPVVFNILWCQEAVDTQGNFQVPSEKQLKSCHGHVILLVGYDESTHKYLFRNSWGKDWGNNGYGTIPEEYINNYCESCRYLKNLHHYAQDVQDLVLKSTKGVSGQLQ